MSRLQWKNKQSRFYVQRWQMRGRHPSAPHTHRGFAEVFWIEEGEAVHLINKTRAPLPRGSLVMIREKDCHGYDNETKDGFLLVNIAFPIDTLTFLKKRYFPNDSRFFWTPSNLPAQYAMTPRQLQWLKEWSLHLAEAPTSHLEIERFLLDLLHEFSTHPPRDSKEEHPEWFSKALEQIRDPQHFVQGTRHLARLAFRSPEHVTRELRARLGITATDAVNQARLEYAAVQLRTTLKKIIGISLECGFRGLGHFYRTFRKNFGITPKEYRERHQAIIR